MMTIQSITTLKDPYYTPSPVTYLPLPVPCLLLPISIYTCLPYPITYLLLSICPYTPLPPTIYMSLYSLLIHTYPYMPSTTLLVLSLYQGTYIPNGSTILQYRASLIPGIAVVLLYVGIQEAQGIYVSYLYISFTPLPITQLYILLPSKDKIRYPITYISN